jgi:hypothetical protein
MNKSDISPNVWIGDESFLFDSSELETVSPDLYNPGYFSMFDVMVHLGSQGHIDLKYEFDPSMNTHIINSINGEKNWWYFAFYHEGSPEQNAYRMDHYLWKEGATLRLYKADPSFLETLYHLFREEVKRREENNGKLILSIVIIRGANLEKAFEDVEVIPFNMVKDIYREGTTTVLDMLMTLKEQNRIDCDIKWFKRYGKAIINDYWLVSLDGDKFAGRVGWAYEVGSFKVWRGLHRPHIPIGCRVLISPDYVEFFWHP